MSKNKWTIAVDVDGVIHSYMSGWQGPANLPDPPVPGAIEWLNEIVNHYEVAICSTRAETSEGRAAIWGYLLNNGLNGNTVDHITIDPGKPPALVYIDDRGFRFEGTFPTAEELRVLKPWWQKS